MTNTIYLDNGATTQIAPEVLKAMKPYLTKKFGNPNSIHLFGREPAKAIEMVRKRILEKLGAKRGILVFTGCGSESNNLAIKGVAFANRNKGKHIITSKIEHSCVLESCKWLEKQGFEITYLDVNKEGIVDVGALKKAIRKDTILVSVMHVNNEIGTIQPICEIGKICREKGIYFHTDACQSFTKVPLNVDKYFLDLVTISAHKIHGPKGVAALYIQNNVKIEPWVHGGGQEDGLRGGTQNIPGIIGFGAAVDVIKPEDIKKMTEIRNKTIKEILKIKGSHLNGSLTQRACNNINVRFDKIEGESLLMHLDNLGIAVSTGSACASKSLEPSHVLRALGLSPEQTHGSLRITISKYTTNKEIDYFLSVLPKFIEKLRNISPLK
ncbi:MAG: cysteine desulfurase NifS [Candidatus Huberarchaeum crystalense]|uniref:cysteine desulfurase n=1 Tax=Huberarchaeum crystalense TaxID=2014257 RepID=A0A2G9LIV4_HUBC1|nr:cysteine desulfurase [archaeon]PIN66476.1 MAG: cysteine desulfurase NifS [Candidatus Huberarchaeum crystalense]PIV13825.1 MAG: cysteine desulfurase NifS [Candidatus Huberarchaeum crystalense]PIV89756.1 MAG: cysteine desulfurase NifS [Candidatus Huberarchaeum crystalense]PIX28095.1 MAG: cysteine desulfurase NifS [Candidatus Huberarchaeum crystalense]